MTPGPSAADLLSVTHVPASGASIPGLDLEGLRWRQEVAAKGSPYANMKPGQVLPGKRTPGLEGEPKAFKSKAEWRWSFWRKFPNSKARAHLRPWKTLPRRKRKR